MADDPDRDILPVKDNAGYNIPNNKICSSLYEDVVNRQCASKIPRSDLEDRYLRLCEENMCLKKQCNKQHEKIKRLATKLLRVVGDRKRSLPSPLDRQDLVLSDQQNHVQELESANAQLRERLLVMKSQLVTHSRLHSAAHCVCSRSPSRSPVRPASRNANVSEPHKTHEKMRKRSPMRQKRKGQMAVMPACKPLDSDRQKNGNVHNSDEVDLLRNQLNMMEQDMESMREESNAQLSTLEKELAQDKRKQVADNVEMIRLKRGLKQQSAQLAALQAQNSSTTRDVAAIQEALEQAHKENDNLHYQLLEQKKKYLDMHEEMAKMETSAGTVKDLQQALEDLKQEKNTIKAHNERLLELSASTQAIEVARSQQTIERESSLRSQLSAVQTSLTTLLGEKDELKNALEEEKQTVASLKQAHQELLSKFSELQNQYHSLEQQMDTLKKDGISPSIAHSSSTRIVRTPSLEQSRSTLKSLLQETEVLDEWRSPKRQSIDQGRGLSKQVISEDLSKHLISSELSHSSNAIEENNSAEAKCECKSPSSESCTCGLKSPSKTQPKEETSPLENELELISLNNFPTAASQSATSAQVSTKSSQVSAHEILQLDKATDPMISASNLLQYFSERNSQEELWPKVEDPNLNASQPGNLSNNGINRVNSGQASSGLLEDTVPSPSEISQKWSENRYMNLPPEFQTQSMPGLSYERPNASEPTTSNECSCGNRPYEIDGCSCSRNLRAQETYPNVPDPVRSYQVGSNYLPVNALRLDYSSGEVNDMAALPTNDTYMANHLDTARELEKCRELLRVQYNLNGLYKQELAKMKDQFQYTAEDNNKRITTMCRLIECPASNIPKQQTEKTNIELDSNLNKKRSLMRVGVGQGLFELHAGYMQLSTEGSDRLRKERTMFLTWRFYDQDVAHTPPKPGPEAQFDCSAVYRVQVDDNFIQYIQMEECEINLYASMGERNELLATGFLSFIELLNFPQNKLHAFVQFKTMSPSETPLVCGVLQCWYRLSCDVNLISPNKDEQRNEVQFDDILRIKTLSSVIGTPYEVYSNISSDVISQQVDLEEGISEVIPEEQSEDAGAAVLDSEQNQPHSESSTSQLLEPEHPTSSDSFPEEPKFEETEEPKFEQAEEPKFEQLQEKKSDRLPLTQLEQSSKSSGMGDSSVTSTATSEALKSDSVPQTNSKDLTLFQKRIQQLRKGLYSESSSHLLLIDEPDSKSLKELHRTAAKSDDSVPLSKMAPVAKDKHGSESSSDSPSQKEFEDQLTNEIRKSKDGSLVATRETKDVLEILDEQSWNRHVHKSSSSTTGQPDTLPDEAMNEDLQSKESATPKESEKPPENKKESSSSEITVEIHWMTLDPESTPLRNPDIVQLYVEFAFMGMRGSELETAMSLPTPTTADQRLVFNYSKSFDVSQETQPVRRMELNKLISRSSLEHSIHFMVISEPLAEDSNVKDCEEIGQASVNIQTMMLEGRDYDPINIAILSVDGRQENIGNLNVSIRGVQTLMEIGEED